MIPSIVLLAMTSRVLLSVAGHQILPSANFGIIKVLHNSQTSVLHVHG